MLEREKNVSVSQIWDLRSVIDKDNFLITLMLVHINMN